MECREASKSTAKVSASPFLSTSRALPLGCRIFVPACTHSGFDTVQWGWQLFTPPNNHSRADQDLPLLRQEESASTAQANQTVPKKKTKTLMVPWTVSPWGGRRGLLAQGRRYTRQGRGCLLPAGKFTVQESCHQSQAGRPGTRPGAVPRHGVAREAGWGSLAAKRAGPSPDCG